MNIDVHEFREFGNINLTKSSIGQTMTDQPTDTFIRRAAGTDETRIRLSSLPHGVKLPSLPFCPDCSGRGSFLINPFATGGSNGAGGAENLAQCLTCKDAHDWYMKHGALPAELEALRTPKPSQEKP